MAFGGLCLSVWDSIDCVLILVFGICFMVETSWCDVVLMLSCCSLVVLIWCLCLVGLLFGCLLCVLICGLFGC